MPSASLKHKAVSATIWSGVETFARLGLQFVITMVLARLLTPADYGAVGIISVFIGLAGVFIDLGLFSALVQRKNVTDTDLSSFFYFNTVAALVISLLIGLAASWIAVFYKMPILKPLTWLLAANLFIGSFGTVQGLVLTKTIDFRRKCGISLIPAVIAGCVAILMAWQGYGVWSLCVQFLIASTLRVLSGWWVIDWRPQWVFSWISIRSLFKSSSFLFLAEVSNALFSRINTLVIGKFYSAADLGYYSRGDGLQMLPGSVLSGIVENVAFPVFSSEHENKALLRAGLKKSITILMMLSMPIMVGMMVTAKPLVRVLFGAQWLPCVPYVQILCLSGLFRPLLVLNGSVHKALGLFSLIFRVDVAKRILAVLLLAITCPIGIAAIAWSTVLISVLNFMIAGYYSGKFIQYGLMRQILDLMPCISGCLVMVAGVWALSWLPIHPPIVMLAVQIASGAAIYVTFCHVFKLEAFTDALAIVRSRLPFGRV